MQYTKMVHILHDAAQKTVFSHRHTRLIPQPGTELSRAQGGAWVKD